MRFPLFARRPRCAYLPTRQNIGLEIASGVASTVAYRDSYDSRARGNLNDRARTHQSFDRANKSRAFTTIKNQLDAILLADRGDDGGGSDVYARWTVYSYSMTSALYRFVVATSSCQIRSLC